MLAFGVVRSAPRAVAALRTASSAPATLKSPVRAYSTGDEAVTVTRDQAADGKHTGVVTITLNRPKLLNALTEDMGNKFREVVEVLKADESVRAVVLTGAGRAFSAGGDMKFLKDRMTTPPQRNAEIMRKFYERFMSVRRLDVPVIAAVNGMAIGAGFCLALLCDMRVGAAGTKVGLNFARIGMHSGMAGSHTLPILVGPQAASRMLLTGELISSEEAAKYGLFLSLHPAEDVVDAGVALARKVAAASPVAVRGMTKTLRMRVDDGLERALQREADSQAHGYAMQDYAEGIDAILSKREPIFKDFSEHGK
ncbi:enoyl-CoA hydratase [Hyaloraphidium curvatum]|nr:enoyl-CoA hydratase [Hyaloraphidium curvatum]